MHDPSTLAFDIKYPFKRGGYRPSFISIWHVDPDIRGDDDSCGWFKRARHGDKAVLEKIIKRFAFDWDSKFVSDGSGKTYFTGYFYPEGEGAGMPNMSVTAVGLNLFFVAAGEYFESTGQSNWKKARKFMQKNLFDIMLFIENPTDSLRDSIVRKWGCSEKREERIRSMASCIYGWILRNQRPWYRHPRWHIHHWKLQIHPLQDFKRWAFSRCCKCGKRFKFGESPISDNWDSTGPLWFRSETGIYHGNCHGNCHGDSSPVENKPA
jgi:hypothetical protein